MLSISLSFSLFLCEEIERSALNCIYSLPSLQSIPVNCYHCIYSKFIFFSGGVLYAIYVMGHLSGSSKNTNKKIPQFFLSSIYLKSHFSCLIVG
jgi:hypothetical protein